MKRLGRLITPDFQQIATDALAQSRAGIRQPNTLRLFGLAT